MPGYADNPAHELQMCYFAVLRYITWWVNHRWCSSASIHLSPSHIKPHYWCSKNQDDVYWLSFCGTQPSLHYRCHVQPAGLVIFYFFFFLRVSVWVLMYVGVCGKATGLASLLSPLDVGRRVLPRHACIQLRARPHGSVQQSARPGYCAASHPEQSCSFR